MKLSDLLDLLCDSLEIDRGSLTLATEIDSVDEWNSVGWLTIMSELDDRLGVQLPSAEIRKMQTVGDLVSYLKTKAEISE